MLWLAVERRGLWTLLVYVSRVFSLLYFLSVLPAVHRSRLEEKSKRNETKYRHGNQTSAGEEKAKGVEESEEKMNPRAGYAVLRNGSVGTRKPRAGLRVITVFISLDRHHPHRAKQGPLATSDGGGAGGGGGGRNGEETKWEEIDKRCPPTTPVPPTIPAFALTPTPASSCYTINFS